MTVNEEFPVGLSVPDQTMQLRPPPVGVNTKIDANEPKAHILQLFPDLFEGIGTMESSSGCQPKDKASCASSTQNPT